MRARWLLLSMAALWLSSCAALHPPGVASGTRLVSPAASPSPAESGTAIQLSAPSADAVWALVAYRQLYRSTDQGATWVQFAIPAQPGVRPAVSFIDQHEGWLLAPGTPATQCQQAAAAVWHTTDGGKTWNQLAGAGIGSNQCKNGIWFVDRLQGYISAWDDMHRPTVYHTSDGGSHWSPTTIADPPDFKTQPDGDTLHVLWLKQFGATAYMEVAGHQGEGTPYPQVADRQYMYASSDGGATWRWLEKTSSPTLVMVTATRWLDLGVAGQPSESVDGGRQFHPFATDFNSDAPGATQFVFAGAKLGYAAGDGLLQVTRDGGAHWSRIPSPGAQPAATPSITPSQIAMPSDAIISAPSARVVWALVASQYLFRSTDQGERWEQRAWAGNPGGGGPPLISFVDDTTGWALLPDVPSSQCTQQDAQLWRTSDGAGTWQMLSTIGIDREQCKETLYFSDALHGFIGADDPTGEMIYRTADGGLTWTGTPVPNPPGFTPGGGRLPLTAIKAFGTTVLAYAPPYVFRSVDGGVSWTFVFAESAQTLGNLVFVSDLRWVVFENDQSASETLDGGRTWHSFTTDYDDAAPVRTVFAFADLQVGYGTVRGDLHRTLDGGVHWEMIKNSWP